MKKTLLARGSLSHYLVIAKVGKAHGLKGEFYLQVFYDTEKLDELPALYKQTGEDFEPVEGLTLRWNGRRVLAKISGVECREDLQNLGFTELYIQKQDLPEPDAGEYYFTDLVGCQCIYKGESFGVVADMVNHGSCDLFEIHTSQGKVFYIPFLNALVQDIRLEDKAIYFVSLEGYI